MPQSATTQQDGDHRGSERVQRRRDRRRAQILAQATRVLIAHGYQGLHLEDVAERADIAKATLYHYYPSKDALVAAALNNIFDQVMARLRHRLETTTSTSAQSLLRELIAEQLLISTEADTQDVAVFFYPSTWPATFEEDIRAKRREHDALIRAVAQRGMDNGEFTCPDLAVAMHCLHGVLNQAPLWVRPTWPHDQRQTARDQVANSAMRLFL
ncbi:TetR/AcrR family transcriptional regulator [Kocuria sp.]|uniref:TetR/AcrR family transcriptional regulator n=1 Tax=Kocuria sp. TaxID=1871328 RepID=UPI0026DEAD51|nr:TetR/AcrR family transcriptional regulator [Kocuria sp.]MDO5618239.1 TetR/AcrR family transcriptional regulator [Kocuria sp.]